MQRMRIALTLGLVLSVPLHAAVAAEDILLKTALDARAGSVERARAFADLRAVATEKSISALAALLNDRAWSHPARSVLEALPGPAADRALLQALDAVSDETLRAGVVNSLGHRRCTEAAAPIAKLLGAGSSVMTEAALNALGEIASSRALEALLAYQPTAASTTSWADALVRAADSLQRRDRSNAFKAYQLVVSRGPDAQVVAATVGLAHLAEDPVWSVVDALSSKRRPRQLAALALLRAGEFGPALTEAVGRSFGTLAPPLQMQVLSVLQDRGDRAAVSTARTGIRSSDTTVRAAAAKLLAVFGEESDAAGLVPMMTGEDDLAAAARLALSRLPGDHPTRLLLDAFHGTGAVRAAALEVLVARGYRALVPELVRPELYADEDFSGPAANALATLGTGRDFRAALELYRQFPPARRPLLDAALRRLATKDSDAATATAAVVAALEKLPASESGSLYVLLAAIGGDAAFDALSAAAKSAAVEQRKAALRAFGNWRDTQPTTFLLERARDDVDAAVRSSAVRAATNLYSKSAFGGAGAGPVAALVPGTIEGLKKTWPLATNRMDRNAILVALRGLKDPNAKALADEWEAVMK